jgi:hypothetical protein
LKSNDKRQQAYTASDKHKHKQYHPSVVKQHVFPFLSDESVSENEADAYDATTKRSFLCQQKGKLHHQ